MGIIMLLSKNEVLLRIFQGDECMNGNVVILGINIDIHTFN